MSELRLEVVSFSSEQTDRPASNLNHNDTENPGWQSEPFIFLFYSYLHQLSIEIAYIHRSSY